MPESRDRQGLWSFFWERGEYEGRKPVLSKKMGFLSPQKFTSFLKLIPPKVLGKITIVNGN